MEILIASLSDNTLKQYSSILKEWLKFCQLNNFCPYSSSIIEVLKFFTQKSKQGASYGSLNSARAALNQILDNPLSENLLIKRFLSGVSKIRPSRPKYNRTWDPSIVLDYLSKYYPLESLSFEKLTEKLIMLLALITAHRAQTFSLIKVKNIFIGDEKVEIEIPDRIKTSGPGRTQPLLILPYFHDKLELCVATTLKFYLEKTKVFRNNIENLFLSIKKPVKPVKSQTISGWIKKVMGDSGIDVSKFTSHSTRHAATSKAYSKGVDINVIKNAASWTEKSQVFAKFYNKPISCNKSFASAILKE